MTLLKYTYYINLITIILFCVYSVFAALVVVAHCDFFDSDPSDSFSTSTSSDELSAEISQEDLSVMLSAELPPACQKIPQAFTPDLKRVPIFIVYSNVRFLIQSFVFDFFFSWVDFGTKRLGYHLLLHPIIHAKQC